MALLSREGFINILKERILVLDGAMGTTIMTYNLSGNDFLGGKGNNDILNITRPDVIKEIHARFIESGADIIETNTFSSNAISQADYNCVERVYELNLKGARIARDVADSYNLKGRKVLVAGSMGPTVKSLSLAADVNMPEVREISFDMMAEAYREQVHGLLDGGVDILLLETVYDSLNLKAALYAISLELEERFNDITAVAVMVSATINDKSGRLLSGTTLEGLYTAISHFPIASFGLNCSFGPADMVGFIEDLQWVPLPLSLYPNAGLPNEMGEYDETPESMALLLSKLTSAGKVNILGGCCGTRYEHIKAIKKISQGAKPRLFNKEYGGDNVLYLSGLEQLRVNAQESNFVNVGERTNVAGSAKFAKLVREEKWEEAADVARKQIEGGATIIDINMDDSMLDGKVAMGKFLRYIANEPDIAKVPLMIDSSNWDRILEGLKSSVGKPIVNSISLKGGVEEFIAHAKEIKRLGAAVIVMAFDEQGQAVTYERKIEICSRAFDILTKEVGFLPTDIIFDVNILTVATGIEEHNSYAVDFIRAVKWIKENLKGCKTSGGVSNLSFAFRGNNRVREAMHSVFLYYAIKSGLDMAIVNPSMLQVYDNIDIELRERVEAVILNDNSKFNNPTESLIELAQKIKEREILEKEGRVLDNETKRDSWRELSLDERVSYSLIKGVTDYLRDDILEALALYKRAVDVIEGPLMGGMEKIGELFGEGKMFLPQVVKSAKVMKMAVQILEPYIEEEGLNGVNSNKSCVVIATAKGDVHDIGKNIASIVLGCNNFNVVDLGVMVENKVIVEQALANKASIIGVSGLITPSLEQMEQLAIMLEENKGRMLRELGYLIPLIVGGATTSSVHTAVKIAPLYSGCVIYGGDASRTAALSKRIDIALENGEFAQFEQEIKCEQQAIRDKYNSRRENRLDVAEAREKRPIFSEKSFVQNPKFGEENIFFNSLDINRLVKYIDWGAYLNFWGFKGTLERILYSNDTLLSAEAEEIYNRGLGLVGEAAIGGEFKVSGVINFYQAYAIVEDNIDKILLFNLDNLNAPVAKIPVPRATRVGEEFLSIADYFPLYGDGVIKNIADYKDDNRHLSGPRIGVYILSVKDLRGEEFAALSFERLLRHSICARLVDSCCSWMVEQVAFGEKVITPSFGYPATPDHSLKRIVFDLTDAEKRLDIKLLDSYAIVPSTSLCGLIIAHPNAKYFGL